MRLIYEAIFLSDTTKEGNIELDLNFSKFLSFVRVLYIPVKTLLCGKFVSSSEN